MIDVTHVLGQPAISLRTAEQTGTVKGFRFDGGRVVSVDIGDGRIIPVESVRTFEGDALTYETEPNPTSDSGAEPASGQQPHPVASETDEDDSTSEDADTLAGELPLPGAKTEIPWHGNPIGTVLLSEMGDALGTLARMHIDETGLVTAVADTDGHTFDGDRVMTVGRFATIIAHRNDESS